MNIIRDASARFTAFAYSQNRSQVSLEMENDINDDMSEIGFVLDSVQLLNIQFPKNFSDTLQETLMLQQQVTQAEMNKDAEEVALKAELSKSDVTAKGILIDAKTEAYSINQTAFADSQSLVASLETEAASHLNMIYFFSNLSSATSVDDKMREGRKQFVDWYWMNQISGSAASKNVAVSIPPAFAYNN